MARPLVSALVSASLLVAVAGCRPHVDAASPAAREAGPEIWEPTGWRASARIVNVQRTAGGRIFRQTTDGYEILDDKGQVLIGPVDICPAAHLWPLWRAAHADPAFPWVIVPCGDGTYALDPVTGVSRVFGPPVDEVQVTDMATLRVGATFTSYNGELREVQRRTLPYEPDQWVSRRGVVAELPSGWPSRVVWTDLGGQVHDEEMGRDVWEVATDGARITVDERTTLDGAVHSILWIDVASGRLAGTIDLGHHRPTAMGFVGSTLWAAMEDGYHRWNGATEELPTVEVRLPRRSLYDGDSFSWSDHGVLAWAGATFASWSSDGHAMSPQPGPWWSVDSIGLSADGGTISIVDPTGRVSVLQNGIVSGWYSSDLPQTAEPSFDGTTIVESHGAAGGLAIRAVPDGHLLFMAKHGNGSWRGAWTPDDCFADAEWFDETRSVVYGWCRNESDGLPPSQAVDGSFQSPLVMLGGGNEVVTVSWPDLGPPTLVWWPVGPHAAGQSQVVQPSRTTSLPDRTTDVWGGVYDDAGHLTVGLCIDDDCGVWRPPGNPVLGFGDDGRRLHLSADGAYVVAVEGTRVGVYDTDHQLVRTAELAAKPVDVQMATTVALFQLADDRIEVVPLRTEP